MEKDNFYVVWGKFNPSPRSADDDTEYPVDKLILATSDYWEALEKFASMKKELYDFADWVEVYFAQNIVFTERTL